MRSFLNVIIALLIITFASCKQHLTADRIYINTKIWTGDSANAAATSIAIKDSLIVYVGNDYTPYKDANTELIDLGGKMIVPGFIDNHTHFLMGGYQLASVNLRDVKTRAAFIQTLKDYTLSLTDKRWIKGGDWDHEAWGGELPRKEWIDSVSGSHPVFISRYDGHMALVNSMVLKSAGIDKNTPNPRGGEIIRDPKTGEPTGVLKDAAMQLAEKVMPAETDAELDESLERAVKHAFSLGVTQVTDMGSYGGWIDLSVYRRAHANHKQGIRIYAMVPINTWAKLDSLIQQNGRGDDMLRWGGLKGFVDGSLGSTTAWFFTPYLDAPGATGLQVTDTVMLRNWILQADSAGLQVATHAIGDRAINWLLDVYGEAQKRHKENHRFRIEHAQHIAQEDIPRFAPLNVIASMQPYHAIDDGKWAHKRLDSARLKGTYAFNDLIKQQALLTFGSDWSVGPIDPLAGIYAAVTRRTLDDKNPGGWFPEQKITVEQALKYYTVNNAYAGFHEQKTGKLKAGMLADLAVLSDDLFSVKPEELQHVKVIRTIINGKEVFVRK
jgi:predicted amidohydrolase YtcJ